MSVRKVLLHRIAQQELYDATRWYRVREEELGRQFHRAVKDLMRQIAANPDHYSIVSGDRRKAVLERFPFILIFRVLDQHIQILNVFHTSRDPQEWRS